MLHVLPKRPQGRLKGNLDVPEVPKRTPKITLSALIPGVSAIYNELRNPYEEPILSSQDKEHAVTPATA